MIAPHPGVGIFVANKRRSAIRQPYDSLVEGHFLSSSVLVWLIANS
jgi:hypothetical protein